MPDEVSKQNDVEGCPPCASSKEMGVNQGNQASLGEGSIEMDAEDE